MSSSFFSSFQNGNRDVEVSGAEEDVVKAVSAIKAILSGSGGFGSRGDGEFITFLIADENVLYLNSNTFFIMCLIDGGDGDKPREVYVPAEPTENGDELFNNNIRAGINFKNFDLRLQVIEGHDLRLQGQRLPVRSINNNRHNQLD